MRFHRVFGAGLLTSAFLVPGCGSSSGKPDTVYTRLGEHDGVTKVVQDFYGLVSKDQKINGYFLNSSLDAQHLQDCLVDQIGNATGGPETYSCRSMKDAHARLGISKQDFDDLITDMTTALTNAKVSPADMGTILGVLRPMSADIVTDPSNNATIYQRVGRKPAIASVVTDFHARVAADPMINAFFATADIPRLATCLVRQVCGVAGGPCIYGKEIPGADPAVKSQCLDMKAAHTGIPIAKADFDELAKDFVAAVDAAGVTLNDRNAMVTAISPLCKDIVQTDPSDCP